MYVQQSIANARESRCKIETAATATFGFYYMYGDSLDYTTPHGPRVGPTGPHGAGPTPPASKQARDQ